MAISKLEVGVVPLGIGGDSLRSAAAKINANFSDQTNAASRLVGTGAEQLPLSKDIPSLLGTAATKNVGTAAGNVMEVGAFSLGTSDFTSITALNIDDYTVKDKANKNRFLSLKDQSRLLSDHLLTAGLSMACSSDWATQMLFPLTSSNSAPIYRTYYDATTWSGWATFYTTTNTTKDSNGFLKAASPIVKVFADRVELNDDAERQNVTYKRHGIGDYTITTVSGLSTDGWYIELPKDMNGNPKVAVTLSEVDGVISLKSYKRIFSMETFTFEPDLDNPLDIPDTRWIDLRLNEIPVEIPDDIQAEV